MKKKSFVVRIDEETYKLLEKWAQDEFRSVNGQIEYLLHEALVKSKRKKPSKEE
ncbi:MULTISPECIES: Arc family DNA-binding protein [Sphingobacterium]|uniref:Toxin-antitoxin system HicB family antitoxin n=1 Tax=Sphingobacterium thermophilum TaxID=768534 RepID=A0ABP8QZJ8_9SPHI|nr:Arc family DNA-binding protein [Sphingobacterium sp. T2]